MRNISVLVKCILDPVAIQWNYREGGPDYLAQVWNKADLHGLQWACAYKAANGANITAVVAMPRSADILLERIKRFAVDKIVVILLPDEPHGQHAAAACLADVLRNDPCDLIICGSEGEDERKGVTPVLVAELLGIPCFTHIQQISPGKEREWTVHCKEGRGKEQRFQVQLPALIGVLRSVAELAYLPRPGAKRDGIEVIYRETTAPDSWPPSYIRRKLAEPQPHIHYLDVPEESLAQHRILHIAGVFGGQAQAERKKSGLTPDFMRDTARQLEKWLQEGT